jgi:hypothetical protein
MFTHPYAAEMLAAQHTRELQADADRTRLARQAATFKRATPHHTPPSRAHRHWSLWPARQHRRRTAAKAT